MKKFYGLVGFLLSALIPAIGLGQVRGTDDTGNILEFTSPVKRVVSLSPHNTEIMFEIGAGDLLVGVVDHSDYPPEAASIPSVGGYHQTNIELILSLKPDLILGWQSGNDSRVLTKLKQMGFSLYLTEPKTLKDIERTMQQLAQLTAVEITAEPRIKRFKKTREKLLLENKDKPPVTVFYQVWQEPLYTLGGTHFSQDLFALCNVKNAFGDIMENAPIVSIESIISRDPDMMLTGHRHGKKAFKQLEEKWSAWSQLSAVKNKQLHFVDADLFTRSSPRALQGAVHLCELADGVRAMKKANIN